MDKKSLVTCVTQVKKTDQVTFCSLPVNVIVKCKRLVAE